MRPTPCCWCLLLGLVVSAGRVAAQEEEEGDARGVDVLQAEVERLKAEVGALRAENSALKEKLAAASAAATTRPATTRATTTAVNRYELGAPATLGGYRYASPAGWAPAPPKDNATQAMYRAPDKQAVILVQVKAKGAAPVAMQPKYAQSVIQMLKLDFAKNKTEIVEQPVVVPDPRFYVRIRERIRVKGDKVADQTHMYLVVGKDMVELTAITTSEAPEQVAATQRLAEEMLLSLKAAK